MPAPPRDSRFRRSTPATSPRQSIPSPTASNRSEAAYCSPAPAARSQDGVVLSCDPSPLIAHWGTVNHLQTQPEHRDQGIGSALMRRLRQVARDEMGLEQLHLAARGGTGLEDFYARLGWREVGRWPGKLRLAPDDTRDEILMILTPL